MATGEGVAEAVGVEAAVEEVAVAEEGVAAAEPACEGITSAVGTVPGPTGQSRGQCKRCS